jgi:Cadherin-like beta sandwich domain/Baseplate J-like protein
MSRAVTLKDYANLAKVNTSVSKANAVAASRNSVTVYIAPLVTDQSGDLYPGFDATNTNTTAAMSTLQNVVSGALSSKAQIGTTVTVSPPTYVPVDVTVKYVKRVQFTDAQVIAGITSALVTSFGFNYTTFADVIYPEEIESVLRNVESVVSATVIKSNRHSDGSPGRKTLAGAASEIFVFSESNIVAYPVASLVTLASSTGTWSTTFSATSYTYSVTITGTSMTFTPTVYSAGDTITYSVNGATAVSVTSGSATGSISISTGTTPIVFTVTSSDGTVTSVYTVNVIK